jgi:hypothetical protein
VAAGLGGFTDSPYSAVVLLRRKQDNGILQLTTPFYYCLHMSLIPGSRSAATSSEDAGVYLFELANQENLK